MSLRAKLNMVAAVVLAAVLGAVILSLRSGQQEIRDQADAQARAATKANREAILDNQAALCAIGRLAAAVPIVAADEEALRVVRRRLARIDCRVVARQITERTTENGAAAPAPTPSPPSSPDPPARGPRGPRGKPAPKPSPTPSPEPEPEPDCTVSALGLCL